MAKSGDPDQTAPRSTLFASILNSTVMLDNYLQQTTSADDSFRCIIMQPAANQIKIECKKVTVENLLLWGGGGGGQPFQAV